MLNLIKLEIKKFKLKDTMKGAFISILVIALIMCLITLAPKSIDKPFRDYKDVLNVTDSLVRSVFIIYSSTILSKLVISEFKNKTMNLMFMYPIKRKKILASKLIIVSVFTFMSIIIGNLVIGMSLYFMNKYINFAPDPTLQIINNKIINIVINAVAASGISLIPLFFGMRKKTTTSTIIPSIILVTLVCSNTSDFSLAEILPVTLSIGAIGVLIAYLTIKNIENVDVV